MLIRSNQRSAVSGQKRAIYLTLLFWSFSISANAQCAMCRAALEGEGNKAKAEAVNDGIVYLMIIPYLLVGVIFWYIYQSRKKLKKSEN